MGLVSSEDIVLSLGYEYIYLARQDWPVFSFDSDYLFPILTDVTRLQGKVEAPSNQLGFVQSKEWNHISPC